jgi:two-component system, NtrC family, sensor kinase
VSVSHDLTTRKRAEAALRASQEKLQRILETSNDGVWILDAQGRTEFLNRRAGEIFGLDPQQAQGRPLVDCVPESLVDAAHDLLESIGRGEGFQRELDVDFFIEEGPKTIVRTLEGVRRLATIVRAMKEFAHPDQKEMVETDLNRAVTATLEVARNEYKYVADLQLDLGELPPVTCYPGELNQVFLNVVVNAAHAIEDVVKGTGRRGTIRVSTRQDGDQVVVAIADTGGGIPESLRNRIFEPFFTTKEVGRGTGQGLSLARSIVAKHRGQLTFTSEPGQGTTFSIRIPVAPAPVQAECA